jgi:GMP synthase (glutamine-hydrolysing)
MREAVAIRHVPFEDMGTFADVLDAEGYRIRYLEAGLDDLAALDPLEPDLLMILGGPIGVYDESAYPFITDELTLLKERLTEQRPTLGICLGCQLMARALGAKVYPGGRKEIGWSPLSLSEEGEHSVLRYLSPGQTQVLHWHGDTFDLPEGATLLASSEMYENQAFSWGARALALQFHPEVTVTGMERWFIGHANEIGSTPEISVEQLRRDTALWGPRLEQEGRAFFEEWLKSVS